MFPQFDLRPVLPAVSCLTGYAVLLCMYWHDPGMALGYSLVLTGYIMEHYQSLRQKP